MVILDQLQELIFKLSFEDILLIMNNLIKNDFGELFRDTFNRDDEEFTDDIFKEIEEAKT